VFLDDVFVPDNDILGQINEGWRLARGTLANERVEMSRCDDGAVLDHVGAVVAQGISNSLLAQRGVLTRIEGPQPGAQAALQKLLGVRRHQRAAELAMQLAGVHSICAGAESREFLTTRSLSIAGGSTQILSSPVAERLLGLPRD
jgi:3-oxochol-4-en-24-oyl-CoA dehydrogenase